MKKSEPEIRSLFEHYNETLVKRKKEISEKLTKWGNDLIRQIQDHVNDQRKILHQHFERQKRFFDSERKRFNTEVAAHEKKKESEQIDRLLAECKALKLNLPTIDQYENPITYMRVTTEEQLALIKAEKNNVQQPKENQYQNRSTEDNDHGTGNNASASERLAVQPTSASVRPPSQRSTGNPTSLEQDSSIIDDNNLKPDVKTGDDMTDKCPVCFMIFSKSMEKQDRLRHVNEHYEDD